MRQFRTLAVMVAAASIGFARPAAAQYMLLSEMLEPRGAVLDSAVAVWQKAHAAVPSAWTYSYFAGDNGRRYMTIPMTSMNDMARYDSISARILQRMPGREAWTKQFFTAYNGENLSIWQLDTALSANIENLTSAQMQALLYRRVQIRHVRAEADEEFRTAFKTIVATDAKIGAKMPTVAYRQVVGPGMPAYLFVNYMPSAESYWAAVADRAAKRTACNGCLGDWTRRFANTQRGTENMSLTKIPALSVNR